MNADPNYIDAADYALWEVTEWREIGRELSDWLCLAYIPMPPRNVVQAINQLECLLDAADAREREAVARNRARANASSPIRQART